MRRENKVVSGDYEGCCVIAVLGEVQIISDFASLIFLDSGTVESYEMKDAEPCRMHHLALKFRDGKKSFLEVDRDICTAIIKNCIADGVVRCGITPEKIKSCDPHNKDNCRDCVCVKCIVWPKCCYGRMFARRKSYTNHRN